MEILVLGPSSFDPFYFGYQTLFPINLVLISFFFIFIEFFLFFSTCMLLCICDVVFRG